MSDRVRARIGEALYNQVIAAGIKPTEFDLTEGWIPKTRFDEINTKHKEFSKQIETLTKEKTSLTNQLNGQILENRQSKIETKLKASGAKHTKLLMSQINLDTLEYDEATKDFKNLDPVIDTLKKEYKDMFISETKAPGTSNTGPVGNTNPSNNNSGDIDWEAAVNNLMGNTK